MSNTDDFKKCNNKNCLNPIKLKSEFFKDSSRPDGLSPQCKDCKKGLNKKYCEDNSDKLKKYHQQYFQDNKQHLMSLSTTWIENNRDRNKEIQNDYTVRNLDKKTANCAIRRAKLLKAIPKWANLKKLKKFIQNLDN